MENEVPFVERPLTKKERSITRWLLQHGNNDAMAFLPEVERASVVWMCPCGCDTINFAIVGVRPENAGMTVLSDYYWIDDDGHTNGIFVFSVAGRLAGLEVYSCDGECAVVRIPDPTRLRPMPKPQNFG